jgi:hypothetical protein
VAANPGGTSVTTFLSVCLLVFAGFTGLGILLPPFWPLGDASPPLR